MTQEHLLFNKSTTETAKTSIIKTVECFFFSTNMNLNRREVHMCIALESLFTCSGSLFLNLQSYIHDQTMPMHQNHEASSFLIITIFFSFLHSFTCFMSQVSCGWKHTAAISGGCFHCKSFYFYPILYFNSIILVYV